MRDDQLDIDESYQACDPDEASLPAGAYYRDRDIHERYMPIILRLHAAGWEPVTPRGGLGRAPSGSSGSAEPAETCC